MAGIVVFGGTVEGRRLAEAFLNTDLTIDVCVATEYGASLLPHCPNIHVHAGPMDEEEMETFLEKLRPEYCLDATHPYAAAVTENICQACRKMGISYLRVLREEGKIEGEESFITYADSIGEAVCFLNEALEKTEGNVLITTGSRDLECYTKIKDYRTRCVARVLPTAAVIEKCRELGFEGKNLIGMQGPFSEELNYAMLKQTGASFMVTKNSGKEGGFSEKCEAALRAGVSILVIGRNQTKAEEGLKKEVCSVEELWEILAAEKGAVTDFSLAVKFLNRRYGIPNKREIYLIGAGPGNPALLSGEAREKLNACDVIIGSARILSICSDYKNKPFFRCYQKEQILSFLKEHPEYKKAAVVYSGDIGFYSGAKGMGELLNECGVQEKENGFSYEVHPISGISSSLYFLNRLGIPWEEVKLVSCHGQKINLIPRIRREKRVCALIGDKDAVKRICSSLLEFGMEQVQVTVGEKLSYPEERIIKGSPKELKEQEVDPLSVVLFENPGPEKGKAGAGMKDFLFIRSEGPDRRIPMTKEEIRTLSLSKLCLEETSVLYDIGAGTGSVSVEAALICPLGMVYAVEKKAEGVRLIGKNRRKFGAENIEIVEGEAPEILKELPAPTHVFIGGSSGRLSDILQAVYEKNEKVRVVINGITLETMAQIESIREAYPQFQDMEVIQVNIARSRKLGSYHLMGAENPVYIISFGGEENG